MLIYIILICIIIILIFCFYRKKRDMDDIIMYELNGENYDEAAEELIKMINNKKKRTAKDEYIAGTIYRYYCKDYAAARIKYMSAIEKMCKDRKKEDPVIINEINDVVHETPEFCDLLPLVLRASKVVANDNINKNLEKVKVDKANKKHDCPKAINEMKTWMPNCQNVHDSSVGNDVSSHIIYIIHMNRRINAVKFPLSNIYKKATHKAKRVLDKIKMSGDYKLKNGKLIKELDILTEIWARAHSKINRGREKELENAIIQSLEDCIEKDNIVCLTGRISRIVGSLALLDAESEKLGIGILKTKNMITNEIYDDAASIVRKHTDQDSDLIDRYNSGSRDPDVKELEEKMAAEINSLKNKYAGKLPSCKLNQIIAECISII